MDKKQERHTDRKADWIALAATLGVSGVAVCLLLFCGLYRPFPPPPEYGVEVNLGYSEFGMGDVQAFEPEASPMPEETVAAESAEEEAVMETSDEEAPALAETKPEEKKERARSPRKREGVEKIEVSEDILHQDLYDRLRAWRWREAQAKNLPAYTILQQKAMLGIANTVPTDERTLLAIPGIGRRVVENYGESLLNIVSEWKKTADA